MNLSANQKTTLDTANPYLVLSSHGATLAPMELHKSEHRLGRNPQFADLTVPQDDEVWGLVSRFQALLVEHGQSYYIFDGDGQKRSSNGIFVNNCLIPAEGHLLRAGDRLYIGQNPQDWVMIEYYSMGLTTGFNPPPLQSISLKNKSVVLGRDEGANLRLDAPTVSRQHATIDSNGEGRYVLTDTSVNGVFVDGHKVNGSCVLNDNAIIKIGPYTLILQGDKLLVADLGNNIRLDAFDLLRVVKDEKGRNLTIINDISLPIEPRQFVALVGGSGAGKSTLMRTLLGIEPTTEGKVYLNGQDLRQNFNIYRNQIGYVPQQDIIHKDLTVAEALLYAAKLRLPPDINLSEIVDKTLKQIELTDYKDILVKKLSGGQLKRVSIGVELLADPKLFFLDEPTSGLDPGLDKKMMELLRRLADEGRTIILVTHATSNVSLCDRLVFLGRGGNLCYYGEAESAVKFFNIASNNFADIYISLETSDAVIDKAQEFKQSQLYQKNVTDRLFALQNQHSTNINPAPSTASKKDNPEQVKASVVKQTLTLIERYKKIVLRDKINLLIALLTAPIGISLISFAINDLDPLIIPTKDNPELSSIALSVVFVFTCANLWVGLSGSLQEIVKEADIYFRERLVNLSIFSYLLSKIAVLGTIALLQSILVVIIILIGFKSPEPEIFSWVLGVGITSFLTIFASNNFGLMISSAVSNSTQANSALPLLLIPQIIFSGVLFKMEGVAKFLSWLMISRWSVGAYGTLVDINGMIPAPLKTPDGKEIAQGMEASLSYEPILSNLTLNWGILGAHIIVYLIVTFILQKRKDIF